MGNYTENLPSPGDFLGGQFFLTEMLRSAAAVDVQTIVAALIAVINSLPSGNERVQFYRAAQDVQSAVDACVDKYTLQNPKGGSGKRW